MLKIEIKHIPFIKSEATKIKIISPKFWQFYPRVKVFWKTSQPEVYLINYSTLRILKSQFPA